MRTLKCEVKLSVFKSLTSKFSLDDRQFYSTLKFTFKLLNHNFGMCGRPEERLFFIDEAVKRKVQGF